MMLLFLGPKGNDRGQSFYYETIDDNRFTMKRSRTIVLRSGSMEGAGVDQPMVCRPKAEPLQQ